MSCLHICYEDNVAVFTLEKCIVLFVRRGLANQIVLLIFFFFFLHTCLGENQSISIWLVSCSVEWAVFTVSRNSLASFTKICHRLFVSLPALHMSQLVSLTKVGFFACLFGGVFAQSLLGSHLHICFRGVEGLLNLKSKSHHSCISTYLVYCHLTPGKYK